MESAEKQFRKRNAILACLRGSKAHPSAETLFQMLQQIHSDISLATVYRNLALFRQQGLIVSLGTIDGIERFDGRLDPHIHFACTCCGKVEDVDETDCLSATSLFAENQLGCRVNNAQIMLSGLCKSCLKNN